ncbi:MAG: hypothetical protein BWY89_02057 [Bacteroidetes bacterium ADurb.BinA012]|nr:MAG: hypothetical protein BWY89_02057 [Bacteroidetes bacterium ADurb.BinA012]
MPLTALLQKLAILDFMEAGTVSKSKFTPSPLRFFSWYTSSFIRFHCFTVSVSRAVFLAEPKLVTVSITLTPCWCA